MVTLCVTHILLSYITCLLYLLNFILHSFSFPSLPPWAITRTLKRRCQTLVLRSCLVSQIEGLDDLEALEKLELYDNHVESIDNISRLHNLKVLDLSFNAIRELVPLASCCPLLEEVYVAQNKLRKIEGLEGLVHLKTLDLGANRIRVRG